MLLTIMHILYSVTIKPIEYLIEVLFVLIYKVFENPGYSLIGLSIIISILVLPLYLRADKIQEEENKKQKSISRWTDIIRSTFHGDERYMMISAYYRESNYKPLYALRGTLSLLLQIPFFLAAYHYLSQLELLSGAAFWKISDLGKEDELFSFLGFRINILPILMTVINIFSGAVYTQGRGMREKLQVYLPAMIFLILLYRSPAGLVIYWTSNNVFSLCKNVVTKNIKKGKKLFYVFCLFFCAVIPIYTLCSGKLKEAIVQHDYETIGLYFLPIVLLVMFLLTKRIFKKTENVELKKGDEKGFWLTGVFLSFLYGIMIPLAVISSSAQEFINLYCYRSPLYYIMISFAVFAGVFLLWGNIVYRMLGNPVFQHIYVRIMFCVCIVSVLNYFLFKANVGNLGIRLDFEKEPHFESISRYGNFVLVVLIICSIFLLWKMIRILGYGIIGVLIISSCVMSGIMTWKVCNEIKAARELDIYGAEETEFRLSRNGKNVVVIMLDRALAAYVPFIFRERPELTEKYDGFVYYPNTISSGTTTQNGAPGLYGGYDYVAEALAERSEIWMKEKHNQALRIMPELFAENGFTADVADVPYANYQYVSDYSMYDDLENVNAFHYAGKAVSPEIIVRDQMMTERNLIFYSLYRCVPAIMQDNIYDHGRYLSLQSNRIYYDEKFYDQYQALDKMKEYTYIEDDGDCLIVYSNNLTHEPAFLSPETYQLETEYRESYPNSYLYREFDGQVLDLSVNGAIQHYQVNVAAFLLLGEWFDYLREENVYDNTRIILVSDHGIGGAPGQFPQMMYHIDGEQVDAQRANALLMVKDFGSNGYETDSEFMTNADVPSIAMKDIIENPINPFTGNPIDQSGKENGIDIFWYSKIVPLEDNPVPQPVDAPWYHVERDVYDSDNWSRVYR